jgi:hypothetical protein
MLSVRWEFEAPPEVKDSELAVFRGSKARVEVRQGKEEGYRPEVYVVPNEPGKPDVAEALKRRVALLQSEFPGLAFEAQPGGFHLLIPEALRLGHEEHFGLLTRRFLGYVRDPKSIPAWEKSNMLAKYYVTTKGVELARAARAAGTPLRGPNVRP